MTAPLHKVNQPSLNQVVGDHLERTVFITTVPGISRDLGQLLGTLREVNFWARSRGSIPGSRSPAQALLEIRMIHWIQLECFC
jgi:hypothetical protein